MFKFFKKKQEPNVDNITPEEKPKNKRKKLGLFFWLMLALGSILFGAVGAQMINENFYTTDISTFSLPTDNGQWIEGTVFKPETATSANPAPAVIFCPGFQRTKESHYDIALEIARRGMVCYIIDPYNQGDSSATMNTSASSAEGGAYGVIPLVNYLYDTGNINYIQKDNIHIVGHSAGGNSTMTAGVYFSNLAGGVFEDCKIKSIYISGYIRNIIDVEYEIDDTTGEYALDENGYYKFTEIGWESSKVASLAINVGFGYCKDDEGAWQNINFTGDITRPDSIEAIALATSGGVHTELRKTGIEDGKIYGQPIDGTMKVGYQENSLHGVQPFDVRATSHILYFLDYVTMANTTINPNDQIWMWKQFFQLIMVVGLFLVITPMAVFIAKIPVFKGVVIKPRIVDEIQRGDMNVVKASPEVEKMTTTELITASKPARPKRKRNWIAWAITFFIGFMIACFSFVPMADLSKLLFADAAAHKVTWIFPERMNNAVMLWALLNGIVGIILYFTTFFFIGGRDGEKVKDLGIKIGWKNFLKTIVVAFLTWVGFYVIIALVDFCFHVDARFTFVAIRVTNERYLAYSLMYFPIFFVFYFSLSLRLNTSSITTNKGKNRWLNYLIGMLMNTLGLILIFAIQYISIADHGLMYWTTNWLFTNMLWILVPLMAILPLIQMKIYKHTNNIWLAAMVTCLIFISISMANSVAHGFFNF